MRTTTLAELGRVTAMVLAVALSPLGAGAAGAWPVASEAEVLHGLRCYPDHEDPALWWYLPGGPTLAMDDNKPAFYFERYRYTGRSATGDPGTFWGKGILTLRVRLTTTADAIAAVRTALERRTRRSISLQALPITRIDSVLLYASTREAGPAGDLPDGQWDVRPDRWTERSFTLALSPETTQLLWEELHGDGLAMSLGYSLVGRAVAHRPARDPFGGDPETVAPQEVTLSGDALPIRVSPGSCPECFGSTDLDAHIPAEYPFLEARCYDFVTGLAPSDLGVVIVEVRARAVSGDALIEQVRFRPGASTTATVHFRFAVSLDAPYSYRVARVYGDAHVETGEWRAADDWSGILDVTEYRRAGGPELDPRALY